ncbi:MAG: 6-phosphogluconolactonase, partial [candidate division KSB1 bacterium]|nr:6-phosphogluconolactonase [candidate division KSB1 bacterium]
MEKEFKVDSLSVHIYEDKYEMGEGAADMAAELIEKAIEVKDAATIILATGASQFELLDSLSNRDIEWQKVAAFHLDEYVGIKSTHPASFRRYLNERFVEKVNIGTFYQIEGDCNNVEEECRRLDREFASHKIDVAFLGIGENGHLAFNEPPAIFDDNSSYKEIKLDEASRKQQMGEGWFNDFKDVPKG